MSHPRCCLPPALWPCEPSAVSRWICVTSWVSCERVMTWSRSHGTVLFMHEVQAKHLAGVSSVNLDAWCVWLWQNSSGLLGTVLCFKSSPMSCNSFAKPPTPASIGFDKPLLDPNESITLDWPHSTTCKFLPLLIYFTLCRGISWHNLLFHLIQNNEFQKDFAAC